MADKFVYSTSQKLNTWGCSLDSLTELRFIVSIADEFHFLRAPIPVYYHPGKNIPGVPIKKFYRRYTPDFLIRNHRTNKAFWIEIKPRAFQHHPQLTICTEVARNYIKWKKLDWEYRVVFDDEIILSADQLLLYTDFSRLTSETSRKQWLTEYLQSLHKNQPKQSSTRMAEYVMYGWCVNPINWKK